MMHVRLPVLFATFLLGLGATAQAQEVYSWVDHDGVVHFSDTPPAGQVGDVRTVEIESTRSQDYDPAEDVYNIEATAERMQVLREEFAADREASRERRRSVSPPVMQYDGPAVYGQPYGYPVFPNRPIGPIRPHPPTPPRPEPRPEPPADDTSTWQPPGRSARDAGA